MQIINQCNNPASFWRVKNYTRPQLRGVWHPITLLSTPLSQPMLPQSMLFKAQRRKHIKVTTSWLLYNNTSSVCLRVRHRISYHDICGLNQQSCWSTMWIWSV